ncbi:succinate dehydrogenase assembly factor 2 [Bartonella sp. 220]|uniref:FAD assembly factor SdhE n=1 Tax=Bartonella sp. 220B TaxID=2967260 RepID=UPI0022A9579B|nr:succinate dehydrogenase assembly factor 2 [Bartonella sp. 220B]MCZ2158790.1 succinate dehydrogenase assembly factor 2 [Bartonella sp. 220B]
MTDFDVDGNQLDARRRRLVFRAWHRGIREMDLIFGHYVNAHIAGMSDKMLSELEYILSFDDRDLLTWVTGEILPPFEVDSPLFRDIINYHICINLN